MDFCVWLSLTLNLTGVTDLILYLQIFVDRVHMGILAAGSAVIQKHISVGYLQDVVHIFAGMGDADPCLDNVVQIDVCIGSKLQAY